ncbi:MAG: TolC family protein [Spirulinaceae cyanobacterium SM2_1_0]|nr:TolC family protein [Spirulinaceae cyanobacterium SM2_1_0]
MAALPLEQSEPAIALLWLAQADTPDNEPTDELSAPPEPLSQELEELEPLTPQPNDFEVRDEAAPLVQQPEIIDGRQPVLPPENLDPSANPLLFPTEPDEVTVDLTQPITLLEAIALARRNNQDFRTAFLSLERAQAGLRAALAAQFPTLDASATISRTDSAQSELANRGRQDNAFSDLLGDQDTITDSFDGRVELNYNIYDGGRRPAQIREAERAIRFNQLEVEQIEAQIRLQTITAYYSLQESDARVDIEEAAVENAQQTLRDAELLEQAGLGTRFDVLRAQVDLANSNQNLTNALSTQRVSRRSLVQVLGLGQQVEVTIADEIRPAGTWELPLEETIILAYRNRAELEQQLVQREIEEQQRETALADIRPQVSVFANYNVLGVFNDSEGLADGYQIGARVRWRFFDGGLAQARRDQEAIDMEIAEVSFEQQRNQIRFEVEEAYSNLLASDENIKTATVAVQLAEESLRLARLRFQAGVGTQTDVIDAQTELTRARGNLLTAIISYNSALASLQRAVSNVPTNQLFDLP